jgi:hypothetical protein
MGRIWDFKRMKAAMSEMQIDQQRCPLGKLDKRQITQGYKILAELQKLVSSAEVKETAITMLTNQFYTMIPHDFGAKRPVLIDHISKVKEKSRLLDQLVDIQLAQDFLLQSFVSFSYSLGPTQGEAPLRRLLRATQDPDRGLESPRQGLQTHPEGAREDPQ